MGAERVAFSPHEALVSHAFVVLETGNARVKTGAPMNVLRRYCAWVGQNHQAYLVECCKRMAWSPPPSASRLAAIERQAAENAWMIEEGQRRAAEELRFKRYRADKSTTAS